MTLRSRLTLLTFGVLLVALLAFAGGAGALLWRVELSSIARQISAQTDALWAVASTTSGNLSGTANDILEEQGITAVGRIYAGNSPASSTLRWGGGADGPDTLDPAFMASQELETLRRVGDYLVASRREAGVTVQVGRNLEPLETLLRRYALIAALSLLLLSTLAGWLVAREVRRTLRPLEALAEHVGNLEQPAPIPALSEAGEVGALARALQHSLLALRAEREHETLFLASASHELRTPVTAMLTDLQHTLARPRPPEELHAALERTERTASRLRTLTGNLMTLTRVQRLPESALAEDARAVDLLDLAGEAVDLLQPLALKREIDLWLDGQPCPVRGEASLLNAILENLIGNAIKFTPQGGEVKVQVNVQPSGATITVQDTGAGFPPNMRGEALTGAFVRGQSGVEGFGLGLAVVQQVVEAHGGTLELGGARGGGARVTVTLPLWKPLPVLA